MKPALSVVSGSFTIHRLGPGAVLPDGLKNASPCWIARTSDELSIVCAESIEIESPQSETGWACIRAIGPLDLDLTGISLFALSTFDTDYVLVKVDALPKAVAVLREAGYPIR